MGSREGPGRHVVAWASQASMRVGFAITLPEQLERFAPVARRVPGARWIVPAGQWPSDWLDSRQWTTDSLRLRGFSPPVEPAGDLDLVVAPGGVRPAALRPWLAPTGSVLPFYDERSSRVDVDAFSLSVAGGWAGAAPLAQSVGDPRLDEASLRATRARARAFLGLSPERHRRCVLIRSERGGASLERMAVSLARLRAEADLVVAPSSECWLRSRRPVPAALHGPGIHIVRDRLGWSELLAVADAVLAEPGKMALDALALGKPLTLLAPEPPRSGRVDLARHWPTLGLWTEIPCLFTPSDPLPNTAVAPDEALELQDSLAPELGRWVGRLDGAAAQRAAEAIREEAERRAMERTLAELQQRAAPL